MRLVAVLALCVLLSGCMTSWNDKLDLRVPAGQAMPDTWCVENIRRTGEDVDTYQQHLLHLSAKTAESAGGTYFQVLDSRETFRNAWEDVPTGPKTSMRRQYVQRIRRLSIRVLKGPSGAQEVYSVTDTLRNGTPKVSLFSLPLFSPPKPGLCPDDLQERECTGVCLFSTPPPPPAQPK
ncbi:MAG: hypothetical protein FWD68_09375 [Alphaproteobacteria bacterium]|nr:hypothetical protein [Alphaproteobacteria bacterium]